MKIINLLEEAANHPGNTAEWTHLFAMAAAELRDCEHTNNRDPDNDGKTRVMPHPMVAPIITAARLLVEGTD